MKPLEKGQGFRRFLQELSGPAQDVPLDRTHVADQFASTPVPFFGWPRFPSVRRDGICVRRAEARFAREQGPR